MKGINLPDNGWGLKMADNIIVLEDHRTMEITDTNSRVREISSSISC